MDGFFDAVPFYFGGAAASFVGVSARWEFEYDEGAGFCTVCPDGVYAELCIFVEIFVGDRAASFVCLFRVCKMDRFLESVVF